MIVFIDTETTGLPKLRNASPELGHLWPRLVSVAWACGKSRAPEELIVKPDGFEIPEGASDVHGITTADALEHGRPLPEVMRRVGDIVSRSQFVACYNVDFDKNMLLSEAYRMEDAGLVQVLRRARWYCVMKRVQKYLCTDRYMKLQDAHREICSKSAEYHNASEDVSATRDILLVLASRTPNVSNNV